MSNVALLWDESFLWGLMAYKSLKTLRLCFDLVRSEDIKRGCLKNYRMLFVPGGWASNKLKALGKEGIDQIKRFVYEGGNYFGICGGAGLATMDGLGLLKIQRKPTKERVPSFSGRIYLNISEHPIFTSSPIQLFTNSPVFHAWWPSQFMVNDMDIEVLATFQEALPDSYSSDLNVGNIRKNGNWQELEKLYGINLDPERLKDEPAVVEGRFGKGKVLLSLIHFDSGDENGGGVLRNIWEYLGGRTAGKTEQQSSSQNRAAEQQFKRFEQSHCSTDLLLCCSEIIDFGIRNLLWFWRTPMILQWRRGVRGLEYNTLYVMAKELFELDRQSSRAAEQQFKRFEQSHCSTDLLHSCSTFKEKALRLLMLEGKEIQEGIKIDSYSIGEHLIPEIQALRKELFGDSKSHGGLFKEILDKIDEILYKFLNKSTLP